MDNKKIKKIEYEGIELKPTIGTIQEDYKNVIRFTQKIGDYEDVWEQIIKKYDGMYLDPSSTFLTFKIDSHNKVIYLEDNFSRLQPVPYFFLNGMLINILNLYGIILRIDHKIKVIDDCKCMLYEWKIYYSYIDENYKSKIQWQFRHEAEMHGTLKGFELLNELLKEK